jgi:hypothetical protein
VNIRLRIEGILRGRGRSATVGGSRFPVTSRDAAKRAEAAEAAIPALNEAMVALANEVDNLSREVQRLKKAA